MTRKSELLRATAVGTAMFGVCWIPTNANAQTVPGTGWTGAYVGVFGAFGMSTRTIHLGIPPRDDAYNYVWEGGVPRPRSPGYTGVYNDAIAVQPLNPWPTTFDARDVGWGAGVALGYDYDFGGAVMGIVGDYTFFGGLGAHATWTDHYFQQVLEDPGDSFADPPIPPTYDIANRDTEVNVGAGVRDLMTLRARVGAGTDRLLVYGTAGLAYGRVWIDTTATLSEHYYDAGKQDTYDANSAYAGAYSARRVGFVVGGGAEIALSPRLNLMFEGLYYNLGRISAEAYGHGQYIVDGDTTDPRELILQPYTVDAVMDGAAFKIGLVLRP